MTKAGQRPSIPFVFVQDSSCDSRQKTHKIKYLRKHRKFSQTLFGNALVRETPFRKAWNGIGTTEKWRAPGNRVSKNKSIPKQSLGTRLLNAVVRETPFRKAWNEIGTTEKWRAPGNRVSKYKRVPKQSLGTRGLSFCIFTPDWPNISPHRARRRTLARRM